jgi:hypothetical protein
MTIGTSDLGSLAALRPVISPLELDGYLTGIVVTPRPAPILPSTWMMRLWSEDCPIFDDEAQIETVLGALTGVAQTRASPTGLYPCASVRSPNQDRAERTMRLWLRPKIQALLCRA